MEVQPGDENHDLCFCILFIFVFSAFHIRDQLPLEIKVAENHVERACRSGTVFLVDFSGHMFVEGVFKAGSKRRAW